MRLLPILLTLTILACNPNPHQDNLLTIDLVKNIHNIKDIPLSSIADRIEYIPLKTEGGGLLGEIRGLFELNDTLIIYGYDFCKVYDKYGNYL
ncbi:MAG TPA: 6-bladed beta-propeller [Bacteroidales bacterium]|nr:6-bladed beta-propeller [Bacteroidales bacterium]